MCGFLVFASINRCCVWLAFSTKQSEVSQAAAAGLLSSLYLTSLQSGDIHATSDYAPRWVRLQHVCRAQPAALGRWDLLFFGTSAPDSSSLPSTFVHLVAFAEQNTDYLSIFITISSGTVSELFGASDLDLSWYVLSRLVDVRPRFGPAKKDWLGNGLRCRLVCVYACVCVQRHSAPVSWPPCRCWSSCFPFLFRLLPSHHCESH